MSEETWFDECIEEKAEKPIIGCVIGPWGWDGYGDDKPRISPDKYSKLMDWKEAKPLLHYDWNNGYGAPACHAIAVWTDTDVIFVSQYDGSTSLEKVPRNPTNHKPTMPGG